MRDRAKGKGARSKKHARMKRLSRNGQSRSGIRGSIASFSSENVDVGIRQFIPLTIG